MAKKNREDLDLGIEQGKGSKKETHYHCCDRLACCWSVVGWQGWFLLGGDDAEVADQPAKGSKEQLPKRSIINGPVFVVNLPEAARPNCCKPVFR